MHDRVLMADGAIHMQVGVAAVGVYQRFHDGWRLVYLMLASVERLDGFGSVDGLDGMEGNGVHFL